jgi:hypothetical protein
MEKLEFNIPSAIAHSYFTHEGKTIHLKEKEINYFYSLLYLFRENLKDESKAKIFTKTEEKQLVISDNFKNIPVRIELSEFNNLGVVLKSTYIDLKAFIEILENLEIVINILGKDKKYEIKSIKIIEDFYIKNNILHLTLNEEFLLLFLHTEKYFINVDLNILFKISGYKSKKLYLFIKDYSKLKNKCIKISKENLENLIGKIPAKNRFNTNIENINSIIWQEENISDLKIDYPEISGNKLKKYVFTFENLVKTNNTKKSNNKTASKVENEINTEVMEKAEKILEKCKSKGMNIENENAYKMKIYNNEIKQYELSDSEQEIDSWIKGMNAKHINSINRNNPNIPFITIKNEISNYSIYIDNEFKLTDSFDYFTKNSDETLNMLWKWIDNGEIKIVIEYLVGYPKEYGKLCLLTDSELRKKGKI